MTSRRAIALMLLGSLFATVGFAQPAADFPNRPIRLVVPFPPGGAIDALARKVSDDLRKRLNATIIVDNRPGAGTILGSDIVAKSPADGYTLLLNAPGGIEQLPWMQKMPYDPIKDLQPLSLSALAPNALIVPSTLPIKNYAEFVDYARTRKGQLNFGSLGNGSTSHIFGATLNGKLGMDAVHSPYKGDAPAMIDLIAGRLDYMFNNAASAINFANRGSVRILGVAGTKRIAAIKDVPTLGELGVNDFDLVGWYAIFAPAGTPRPILEKLHTALQETYKTKDFIEFLSLNGLGEADTTIDQFTRQVADEHMKWGKLIKANNIHVD
jgi:tripartite-type tricarboxylate transporter receptor subunit TctC